MKLVDVKHTPIVNNLKNQFVFFAYINMKFQLVIRVAVMSMDHEVGAHLIQRQNNGGHVNLGDGMRLQRVANELTDALEIVQATAYVILIAHPLISLLHPLCREYVKARP